jgi:hypothetical protein
VAASAGVTELPPPPALSSIREYGDRLGDPGFWGPYVRAVLARHRLPEAGWEPGFVGTYPTFLAGEVVDAVGEPSPTPAGEWVVRWSRWSYSWPSSPSGSPGSAAGSGRP